MLFLKACCGEYDISVDLSTGSDELDHELASRLDDFSSFIEDCFEPQVCFRGVKPNVYRKMQLYTELAR